MWAEAAELLFKEMRRVLNSQKAMNIAEKFVVYLQLAKSKSLGYSEPTGRNRWDGMTDGTKQTKIRCVIYRTTSIGDVILATSTLDVLKRLNIEHEVHWIGRSPAIQLLQSSFPDHHFYEVTDEDGSRKVFEELCKLEHLHFIIDLQKSLRSRRFCMKLAHFHRTELYGWDKKSIFRAKLILNASLKGRAKPAPEEVYKPTFYQYQQMAAPMVEAVREILPNINFDPVRQNQARPILNFDHLRGSIDKVWCSELKVGRWLAVSPGASYPTKQAPSSLYVSVLKNLREQIAKENMELGLVFLGNQADRTAALTISEEIDWPFPTMNLCGKLNLLESAVALTFAKGLLGNDSSLGHICEAVGKPCAVIFGPTAEGFGFAPWRKESKAHSVELGCRPCSKHGNKPCRFKDLKCYAEIDVETLANHVFSMIRG